MSSIRFGVGAVGTISTLGARRRRGQVRTVSERLRCGPQAWDRGAGSFYSEVIMSARILLVEDDRTVAEVLLAICARPATRPSGVADGSEAYQQWQRSMPDLVVLDLMLPGMSGLELLRRRRGIADDAAVIILSARGEEQDRLVGLETGADDYVVKPFSPREIVLRVEALLRRTERLAGTQLVNRQIELGRLVVDLGAQVGALAATAS